VSVAGISDREDLRVDFTARTRSERCGNI
jgi:hypothetical protein